MLHAPDPVLTPRLTLRIGVTGHRPHKLDPEQQARIAKGASVILNCLTDAAKKLHSDQRDVFAAETPNLRFVTSLAEGADMILAEAARACGFRLDVILPFPRDAYAESQSFSPEAQATFESFFTETEPHSVLELDGDPSNKVEASLNDLAAGRRVVAHSDVLIAVRDDKQEDGVGGTEQVLRDAVEQGVPVIWMRHSGDACLVTDPDKLSQFDKETQILPHGGSCSNNLIDTIVLRLAPPKLGSKARDRLERFLTEPKRSGSWWSVYDLLRRVLTGRRYRLRVDYSPDAETEDALARFRERSKAIGGGHFAAALTEKLEQRWRRADAVALHYSHAYRSTYILNFMLAGFAVVAGLTSTFWWNADDAIMKKGVFVGIEVGLIFFILLLTFVGGQKGQDSHVRWLERQDWHVRWLERQDWHVRWLEARSLAELFRSARLLALIGNTAAPQTEPTQSEDPDAWVEWLVRATLREIGPPTGSLDDAALKTAITSAIEDEVNGQIAYNRGTEESYRALDHKLHVWGQGLFMTTFVVGIAYIVFAILYCYNIAHPDNDLKDFIKASVTMLGGGLPALGAALFGIKATGDFKLASEQAERTRKELEALKKRLAAAQDAPSRQLTRHLFSSVTRALTSDLRNWEKVYRFRELTVPG